MNNKKAYLLLFGCLMGVVQMYAQNEKNIDSLLVNLKSALLSSSVESTSSIFSSAGGKDEIVNDLRGRHYTRADFRILLVTDYQEIEKVKVEFQYKYFVMIKNRQIERSGYKFGLLYLEKNEHGYALKKTDLFKEVKFNTKLFKLLIIIFSAVISITLTIILFKYGFAKKN